MINLNLIEKIKCMIYTMKERGNCYQAYINDKEFEVIIVSMIQPGKYYVMGQDHKTHCVTLKQLLYKLGRKSNYKDYIRCFKSINPKFNTTEDINACNIR